MGSAREEEEGKAEEEVVGQCESESNGKVTDMGGSVQLSECHGGESHRTST